MAIDTKTKRFSILNMGTPSTDLLPEPSGGFDAADRAHLLDLFSGALGAAAAFFHRRMMGSGGYSHRDT